MSGDTFVAYFGLRFELEPDELESLELRSDSRILAARKVGLKYYWGNFGGLQERYVLFIGYQMGILGPENSESVRLTPQEIDTSFAATRRKLAEASLSGIPEIHLIWQPDI